MDGSGSFLVSRRLWTWVVAGVAAVCWALGAVGGWRAVLIVADKGRGPVAQTQAFGDAATSWWVPAAILTLTVVLLGVGTAIVRHLTDTAVAEDGAEAADAARSVPPIPPAVAAVGELEAAPVDEPDAHASALDGTLADETP